MITASNGNNDITEPQLVKREYLKARRRFKQVFNEEPPKLNIRLDIRKDLKEESSFNTYTREVVIRQTSTAKYAIPMAMMIQAQRARNIGDGLVISDEWLALSRATISSAQLLFVETCQAEDLTAMARVAHGMIEHINPRTTELILLSRAFMNQMADQSAPLDFISKVYELGGYSGASNPFQALVHDIAHMMYSLQIVNNGLSIKEAARQSLKRPHEIIGELVAASSSKEMQRNMATLLEYDYRKTQAMLLHRHSSSVYQ